MVTITTLMAPSGECYEVKASRVSLQCNNCVIHAGALQRWASHNGELYKSSFLFIYVRELLSKYGSRAWSCVVDYFGKNSQTIMLNLNIGLNEIKLYRMAQKKRGHHLIANILKFHDRIAWKSVNFCNIIRWTQSLTFCLKISSRCGAT